MDSVTKGLIQAYHEIQENQTKGYVVTRADKKGNTPAWQGYKAGKKKKDGSPLYRPADHLKEDEIAEGKKADKDYDGDGKIESGKAEYFGSKDKAIKKAMAKESVETYEPSEMMLKLVESGKFTKEELLKFHDVEEGYQRNPEKGEKQDRKYEKVRGERTPMPPRGDKRREDFERWYAANVR
tara:strand:- start:2377 stop:2922 length:546 start_codon:yes stop_codon:yes gene_type:complete